jgi:hypothetical protein
MMVGLMLVIAAGVAAWVLAPLFAPAGGAAADPAPKRLPGDRDPPAPRNGDWT